jgi:hypothetical protein
MMHFELEAALSGDRTTGKTSISSEPICSHTERPTKPEPPVTSILTQGTSAQVIATAVTQRMGCEARQESFAQVAIEAL